MEPRAALWDKVFLLGLSFIDTRYFSLSSAMISSRAIADAAAAAAPAAAAVSAAAPIWPALDGQNETRDFS
jgi:hypothetical protein